MPRPQIIFFDIDDTLYHKAAGIVPPSAINALSALQAQGIMTAIATGRTPGAFPDAIHDLIRRFGMQVVVSINGQYCLYNDEVLVARPMPLDDIASLIALCERHDWAYLQVLSDAMVTSRDDKTVQEALAKIGPYRVDGNAYRHHPVYQMIVFVDESGERLLHDSGIMGDEYQTIRWHPHGLDYLPVSSSKARGIEDCCTRLGIAREQVMAFGDGLNDVEMLRYVGQSVAMGNGRPELKAVADYVTSNIDDDGVYRALTTLGII